MNLEAAAVMYLTLLQYDKKRSKAVLALERRVLVFWFFYFQYVPYRNFCMAKIGSAVF